MASEPTISQTNDTLSQSEAAAAPERTRSGQTYRPNVDILELKEELLLRADMPGLRPEDVDIRFEDRQLTILGRVPPRRGDDVRYLVQEFGVGDFYRTFQVSEQIDASKISAEYRDGVLTLHLPKVEAAKPRQISVRTA